MSLSQVLNKERYILTNSPLLNWSLCFFSITNLVILYKAWALRVWCLKIEDMDDERSVTAVGKLIEKCCQFLLSNWTSIRATMTEGECFTHLLNHSLQFSSQQHCLICIHLQVLLTWNLNISAATCSLYPKGTSNRFFSLFPNEVCVQGVTVLETLESTIAPKTCSIHLSHL